MDEYIYCINDFEEAIEDALEDMFGPDLREFIVKRAREKLEQYVNWYRFMNRNCPGCVSGPKECDVAYGRDRGAGCWEQAKNGKLFDCPVRTNGTIAFSSNGTIKDIDLSERSEPPYPTVSIETLRSELGTFDIDTTPEELQRLREE